MGSSKILIIDDDTASRQYIRNSLLDEGYEAFYAASGKEGLIAAWRDRPDLIIADPVLADLAGEELANRLRADPRSAGIPLVALSSDTSLARRQSCTQAGFSVFLIKSPKAVHEVVGALQELLGKGTRAAKEGGLLIPFLSAKGGTGTSSLCANLAMQVAGNDTAARVVVVDLVLPIGSIAGITGHSHHQSLLTLSQLPAHKATTEYLRTILPPLDLWRFGLLAGSADPERAHELDVGRIGDIVRGLQAAYDVVLVDLGRTLSRISVPLIEQADLIVMVVGSDAATASLSRTVWDYLKSKGIQPDSMFVVLNHAIALEGLGKSEAESIIGLPVKSAVPYLAGTMSMANNEHVPFSVKFPTGKPSKTLNEAARQIASLARNQRSRWNTSRLRTPQAV
jgi:pilus assembly protein CpaE